MISGYLASLVEDDYQVGHWTILKHISLSYCLNPFGVILKNNDIEKIYLDPFCGAGISPLKETENAEIRWTIGSPLIAKTMTDYPFNRYILSDSNKKSVELLAEILSNLDLSENTEIQQENANNLLTKILPECHDNYVFAFLDPSGFRVDWECLCSLLKCNMFDIFLNFQTRQIDRWIATASSETKSRFLGPSYEKISDKMDCDQVLELYINELEELGMKVIPIRIGRNASDAYYYHLLHISQKRLKYHSIVEDLKVFIESLNGEWMKMIWDDLWGGHSKQESLHIEYG